MAVAASAKAAATTGLLPCINQQTTLPAPFARSCEAYAAAGFRHVELWMPRLQEEGIRPAEGLQILRRCNLEVVCACSSDLKLTATEEEFQKNLIELRASLQFCRSLGAKTHVVYSPSVPKPSREDHRRVVSRLAQAGDIAAAQEVRLALEFWAHSNLFGCLPTTLATLRAARHPNVGVCLDTYHFFAGPSKTEDLDDLRRGEIAHVHFHDVPSSTPRERLTDPDRVPPGEGCIGLNQITAALRRTGYQGALSVELFGAEFHEGDPGRVAARCFKALRRYTSV